MSGIVNVCQSPALILAQCCPSQETHHFLMGETKLLLYHSGPQVFQCSLTVEGGRKGTFTDANLSPPPPPPHTNALCNVSAFSKKAAGCPIADSVPNWHATAISLHRLMYQTHNETLFVFLFPFLWYWITTSFSAGCAAVWFGAHGANKRSED